MPVKLGVKGSRQKVPPLIARSLREGGGDKGRPIKEKEYFMKMFED